MLHRMLKMAPELASKTYDLAQSTLVKEAELTDEQQKKALKPLLERLGRHDTPVVDRFSDFSLVSKLRTELSAK